MPIRKEGERVKGTTKVSFGDRKLMTRLWIADKTSRFEKRRATRQLNKKEKESYEQCPTHRAKKAFQAFVKDMRAPPKRFELPDDAADEDLVALDTMSRMGWFVLMERHEALARDEQWRESFLREHLPVSGKARVKSDAAADAFCGQLFAQFGCDDDDDRDDDGDDDANAPSTVAAAAATAPAAAAAALMRRVRMPRVPDDGAMPLLFGRRNMRLMHQYRRLARRCEQSEDTVTSSSAHAFTHHMFHGAHERVERFAFADVEADTAAAAAETPHVTLPNGMERSRSKRKRTGNDEEGDDGDDDNDDCGRRRVADVRVHVDTDYTFSVGGLHASDGGWALIDGNAAPARLLLQPRQWHVAGDSVVDSLMQQQETLQSGTTSSHPPSPSSSSSSSSSSSGRVRHGGRRGRRGRCYSRRSSRYGGSSASSSGDVGGFGFADEAQARQHLRTEQRANGVVFRHAYEVERQANMWSTCQRCREPVHTCDMVVRESIGVEDVACFHASCFDATNAARKRQRLAASEREQAVAQFTPLDVAAVKQDVRAAVDELINGDVRRVRDARDAFMRAQAQRAEAMHEARRALRASDRAADFGARCDRLDKLAREMLAAF